MTIPALVFSSLLLSSPDYRAVDKLTLSPGQELQIHTPMDSIISHDSVLVIKVGERILSAEGDNITVGRYQIEGKGISGWTFNRYDKDRMFLTGTHNSRNGNLEYFLTGFPLQSVDRVLVPDPTVPHVAEEKFEISEKAVYAGVLIGGGALVGAVVGTIYGAKVDDGYPGAGFGGMAVGTGLGLLVGSFLYLRIIYEF